MATRAAGQMRTRAARRIPQTFECRPTPGGLPDNALPDELMIDWGGLPAGTRASVYLPAASADEILAMAARLYSGRPLTRIDDHTLECGATGLTYLPIPTGSASDYAGLLTLELLPGSPQSRRFEVIVRQLTSSGQETDTAGQESVTLRSAALRRVIGAFQISIPIETPSALLAPEERSLAFFRWILSTLDTGNRWYPVIERYVGEISIRVKGLGGNPKLIAPSPVGSTSSEPHPEPPHGQVHRTGKVENLTFDRFGDFEGFLLETDTGERIYYHGRESHLTEVATFVWHARIRVTICSYEHEPHVADRIILHPPASHELTF